MLVFTLILMFECSVFAQSPPTEGLMDEEGLPRVVVGPAEISRDRLAVAPVKCDGAGVVCDEVNKQLRRNMEISTFFEVLNSKTHVANMDKESFTDTKWADWFNIGARYLVKGSVSGSGTYSVQLRFFNVLEKQLITVKGQSHTGLSKLSLIHI